MFLINQNPIVVISTKPFSYSSYNTLFIQAKNM